MSRQSRKFRRPFETTAFRIALILIPLLPRKAVLALAYISGALGMRFDRSGCRIGRANLSVAFGNTKTSAETNQILKESYITMARTFLDIIWFGRHTKKRLNRYVEIAESAKPAFCKKNQIFITAHFGNWELLGLIMAMKGFPLHSIAMPVKNPTVDRLLTRQRQVNGQQIIPREGALRKLLNVLRNDGKAAFLVDQNTPEKQGGIWVKFFGLPVPITPAPAALATKTASEIFIGFCKPLSNGHYHVYATDRINPNEDGEKETVQQVTQQVLSIIEREIRSHPGNWLWTYKRWKYVLKIAGSTDWPFYSEAG
jgi:lauroyl/myristoyl acyltransferase